MANNKETEDGKKEVFRTRSNGRRKIPIERIADQTRKHVTFSKRRLGLFKKASELCALCGVEMAVLTFSERGKLFCFGHPNSDNIIRRYLNLGSFYDEPAGIGLMVEEQNRQRDEIKRKTDEKKRATNRNVVEKKKVGEPVDDEKNCQSSGTNEGCGNWWEVAAVNEMGLYELEQFKACLMELRKNVAEKAEELTENSLMYSSCQAGNVVIDQLDTNQNLSNDVGCNSSGSSTIGNTDFWDNVRDFENPVLGMMSDSSHLISGDDKVANVDVSQSYKFRFMNEVHMMNEVDLESGRDVAHFSNLSQRMGVFNFTVMNQYYQAPMMEDPKGALTNPGVMPQGFKYEGGQL
ncbi:agamous-like MADS-box protein AGL23 [Chenopodium quinoa]|uniref:MADS-box domain-containing protein n=1 Tax=Chenopodium quinoa TaxID=63459 RepID=A0A803LUX2_CHEQI|nr:agamous-like MADS-box protein AGL23 [Chenopodium quinoa]